jgi:hypothetical protein
MSGMLVAQRSHRWRKSSGSTHFTSSYASFFVPATACAPGEQPRLQTCSCNVRAPCKRPSAACTIQGTEGNPQLLRDRIACCTSLPPTISQQSLPRIRSCMKASQRLLWQTEHDCQFQTELFPKGLGHLRPSTSCARDDYACREMVEERGAAIPPLQACGGAGLRAEGQRSAAHGARTPPPGAPGRSRRRARTACACMRGRCRSRGSGGTSPARTSATPRPCTPPQCTP